MSKVGKRNQLSSIAGQGAGASNTFERNIKPGPALANAVSNRALESLANEIQKRRDIVVKTKNKNATTESCTGGWLATLGKRIKRAAGWLGDNFDKFCHRGAGTKIAYRLRDALAIDDELKRSNALDFAFETYEKWAKGKKDVRANLANYLNERLSTDVFKNHKDSLGVGFSELDVYSGIIWFDGFPLRDRESGEAILPWHLRSEKDVSDEEGFFE